MVYGGPNLKADLDDRGARQLMNLPLCPARCPVPAYVKAISYPRYGNTDSNLDAEGKT